MRISMIRFYDRIIKMLTHFMLRIKYIIEILNYRFKTHKSIKNTIQSELLRRKNKGVEFPPLYFLFSFSFSSWELNHP